MVHTFPCLLTDTHANGKMYACSTSMCVSVKRHNTNLKCCRHSWMRACLTHWIALSLRNLIGCRKDAKMRLSKKIKLHVSEQDATTLEFMQGKCRALYNWWVMRLREGERWPGA